MPGYSAQEIVTADSLDDWPDLELVLIEPEPELDLQPRAAPAPEERAA